MKQTILVCEDDQSIRLAIKYVLESKGYEVIESEDGDEILTLISIHYPDLILMDLRMPGVGGEEATEVVKGNRATKHIPIILLSAELRLKQIAEKTGADDFVCKPFDINELEKKVEKYLWMFQIVF